MRIALRPVELGDADAIQRHAADAELAATCNVPHPYPPEGGRRWAEKSIADRSARRRFPSAILADGAFAGLIGINAVNFSDGTAELDYWVARPLWGRGIATGAVRVALEIGFEELGLVCVFSGCRVSNPASAQVLRKNGFTEIEPQVNDGRFGTKFLGESIRRFTHTAVRWDASHAAGIPRANPRANPGP